MSWHLSLHDEKYWKIIAEQQEEDLNLLRKNPIIGKPYTHRYQRIEILLCKK